MNDELRARTIGVISVSGDQHIPQGDRSGDRIESGSSSLIVGCSPFSCATCADEALPAKVLSVDAAAGLALVELSGATGEVDITLVDQVEPGAWLLIHGGVALAWLGATPAEGT